MESDKTIQVLFSTKITSVSHFISAGPYSLNKFRKIMEFMYENKAEYPYQLLPEDYYTGDQTYETLYWLFEQVKFDEDCPFLDFVCEHTYKQILDTIYEKIPVDV